VELRQQCNDHKDAACTAEGKACSLDAELATLQSAQALQKEQLECMVSLYRRLHVFMNGRLVLTGTIHDIPGMVHVSRFGV
jgi:hypothetical protein